MNKDLRVKYFTGLLDDYRTGKKKSHGSMELWYKNGRKSFPVFEINLEYLVYNQYNGRIASLVKSYEKQEGVILDNTQPDHVELIKKFLWNSSKDSNKTTKKDIEKKGQLKYGIVTKDGVIIDGNRRASILEEIASERKDKPVYFLAVVLEEELNESPAEIMRLETTYQMGEDAKVDYNAIEKYLKCKDLIEAEFNEDQIGKMMSETETKIKEYLSILSLMEEYLDKINCSGIYTRLDKTEGAFVDVNNYLDRYKGGRSKIIKWKYDDSDVSDLKLIYFDYIRAIYNKDKKNDDDEGIMGGGDSKDYRFIGQTSKKGSFFSTKEVWEEFRDNHFKNIDPVREEFESGKYSLEKTREENPGLKLDEILKGIDLAWAKETSSHLKRNIGQTKYKLDLKNQQEEPMDLLKRAKSTLESIEIKSKAFLDDSNVYEIVKDLNKIIYQFKKDIEHHEKHK